MSRPRVVLADLPPAEKERMLSFLVANKVEFKPEISGKFSAVVKVVKPEGPGQAAPPSRRAKPDAAPDRLNMAGWVPSASSTPSTSARTAEDAPSQGKVSSLIPVQGELKKRFPTFTGLLPALSQQPRTMLKAELLSFIEEVYTARYSQDLLQIQQHVEAEAIGVQKKKKLPSDFTSFPQSVVTVAGKRYGLRQMVGQVCWSVAKSVEHYRAELEGVEMFARFLEESHDAVDVLFYLEMRWAARQITMPRGHWLRAWRKNQVFAPQPRFLAAHTRSLEGQAVAKTSMPAGARPQLSLKKAMDAVREGIDREAPNALKAGIFARLKQESGNGADLLDWDHFLFICTQEFRKARCITSQRRERQSGGSAQGSLANLANLILETWGISFPEAFSRFDAQGSGTVSYDDFKQVVSQELAYAGDVEELWGVLDVQGKFCLEAEEWEQIDPYDQAGDAKDLEEPSPPPGWDADLTPDESQALLSEAQEVAARLGASLQDRGEVAVDHNEVFGWALRVVLKRHGRSLTERSPSTPGLGKSLEKRDVSSGPYALSLDDLGQAWTGLHEGQDAQPLEGDDQHQDLEGVVRRQLEEATEELVSEALAAASGQDAEDMADLKQALLAEFMLVADALMEAMVTGSLENWLQQLGAEAPGSESQQHQFQALTDELQEVLTAESAENSEEAVARICRATVSAPELRELCALRAGEALQEHGFQPADVPATPDFAQVQDDTEADIEEPAEHHADELAAAEPAEAFLGAEALDGAMQEDDAAADSLDIEDAF